MSNCADRTSFDRDRQKSRATPPPSRRFYEQLKDLLTVNLGIVEFFASFRHGLVDQ